MDGVTGVMILQGCSAMMAYISRKKAIWSLDGGSRGQARPFLVIPNAVFDSLDHDRHAFAFACATSDASFSVCPLMKSRLLV